MSAREWNILKKNVVTYKKKKTRKKVSEDPNRKAEDQRNKQAYAI